MGKLLQLLILAAIAWVAFRVLQGKPPLPSRRDDHDAGAGGAPGAGSGGDVMRRCAHCQVHVPEGECTRSRGHYFCSEAHRDAFFRESR